MQEIIPRRTDLCKCVQDATENERRWIREEGRECREVARMTGIKTMIRSK